MEIWLAGVHRLQQLVPELGHHEELLKHRVHVADAPQVYDAHVLVRVLTFCAFLGDVLPPVRPGQIFEQSPDSVLKEVGKSVRPKDFDHSLQCLISCCPRLLGLRLVLAHATLVPILVEEMAREYLVEDVRLLNHLCQFSGRV